MSSGTITLSGVNADISTSKVKLLGGLQPNANGKYIYEDKDPRLTASNAFSAVANAANLWEKTSGEPIKWATGLDQLQVTPDAGEDFKRLLRPSEKRSVFFHDTDPVTKELIMSGNSAEVTGHECYHAILDSKRPNYLGSWTPDPGAFHESMGDVGALLTTLHDPRVLDKVAEQTGGDLTKQNIAAALASSWESPSTTTAARTHGGTLDPQRYQQLHLERPCHPAFERPARPALSRSAQPFAAVDRRHLGRSHRRRQREYEPGTGTPAPPSPTAPTNC